MFDDMTPRYAPDYVFIVCPDGQDSMKAYRSPVTGSTFYPAGVDRPNRCPIRSDMGVLELKTQQGSRWYGCDRAYINSELRMVVVGCDSRDEVRMKWETVPEEML
jgi:hypothetical protein